VLLFRAMAIEALVMALVLTHREFTFEHNSFSQPLTVRMSLKHFIAVHDNHSSRTCFYSHPWAKNGEVSHIEKDLSKTDGTSMIFRIDDGSLCDRWAFFRLNGAMNPFSDMFKHELVYACAYLKIQFNIFPLPSGGVAALENYRANSVAHRPSSDIAHAQLYHPKHCENRSKNL
jgi:hypothetical protein